VKKLSCIAPIILLKGQSNKGLANLFIELLKEGKPISEAGEVDWKDSYMAVLDKLNPQDMIKLLNLPFKEKYSVRRPDLVMKYYVDFNLV
jgi:hypothetical protein